MSKRIEKFYENRIDVYKHEPYVMPLGRSQSAEVCIFVGVTGGITAFLDNRETKKTGSLVLHPGVKGVIGEQCEYEGGCPGHDIEGSAALVLDVVKRCYAEARRYALSSSGRAIIGFNFQEPVDFKRQLELLEEKREDENFRNLKWKPGALEEYFENLTQRVRRSQQLYPMLNQYESLVEFVQNEHPHSGPNRLTLELSTLLDEDSENMKPYRGDRPNYYYVENPAGGKIQVSLRFLHNLGENGNFTPFYLRDGFVALSFFHSW